MEYTFEKHLEYAKWLLSQDKPMNVLCNELVSRWATDEKMHYILANDVGVEAEIFDLAIRYEDRGYADEKEQNLQKLLALVGASRPKK